jgi:hypothetical protein
VNPGEVLADNRLLTLHLSAIPGRFDMRQHLRQRPLFCPYSWHAARFDNSPVKTRRRTSVHISIAAYTPRAPLSVGGNRGSAAILLTDTDARLCAALFDRRDYPPRAALFDRRSQHGSGGRIRSAHAGPRKPS